jgi:general secretion pathway protein G
MKRNRNAFTLIEFLMLAIIVGVMAAMIAPQFSASSRDTKMSNLKFNLQALRSRLEAYKEEHAGHYPPAATGADFTVQLTQKSDRNTLLNAASGMCGPYLEGSLPANPFNNGTGVAILQGNSAPAGPTGSGDGWQYNPQHGWIYPNDAEFFRSKD